MIKLWGRTNSLNVQKVLWTLAELESLTSGPTPVSSSASSTRPPTGR